MNIVDFTQGEELTLPPRLDNKEALSKERTYRTALSASNFMKLEKEATARGVKPFGLVKSIVTLYLHRQLISVRELPEEIQLSINQHLSKVDSLSLHESL